MSARWYHPARMRALSRPTKSLDGGCTAGITTPPNGMTSISHESGLPDTVGLIAVWDQADQWHGEAEPVIHMLSLMKSKARRSLKGGQDNGVPEVH